MKALREKYSNVDHMQALNKIMKHLLQAKDTSKFSKCLNMIDELIRESFDFLTTVVDGDEIQTSGNLLFNSFDAIMRCERKFETAQDRELIEKLYLFMIELSESEEGLFSEDQERILDLYYIPVYVQSNLYTDDSFKVFLIIFNCVQFNEVVKDVTDMLESLNPSYDFKQDKFEELCISKELILEKCFTNKV